MMGAGKSYWAQHLAKKLGYYWLDTDTLIENKTQLSTASIFEKFGEAFFREKEKQVLENLLTNLSKPTIIATGGGLPCFFNNAVQMNLNGITFFLNTDTKVIAERVFRNKDKRPLLKNYSTEKDLNTFLNHKLQERLKYYNQAKFTLQNNQINEENFIQIISKYSNHES